MGKLYREEGFLSGEECSKKIPIDQWIDSVVETEATLMPEYPFLQQAGRYFTRVLPYLPAELLLPADVKPFRCHENNIRYATQLIRANHPAAKDIKFVSGFYGMSAMNGTVPSEKEYYIYDHSFLTYRGMILDLTTMMYRPLDRMIDQYFGIAFELEVLLNAFIAFDGRHAPGRTMTSLLEILINEPYVM